MNYNKLSKAELSFAKINFCRPNYSKPNYSKPSFSKLNCANTETDCKKQTMDQNSKRS